MRPFVSILLAGALAVALPAGAQVYRWMDDRGGITYGNQPPPDAARLTRLDAGATRPGVEPRRPMREFPGTATQATSAFPGLVDQQTVATAFRAPELRNCEGRRVRCGQPAGPERPGAQKNDAGARTTRAATR